MFLFLVNTLFLTTVCSSIQNMKSFLVVLLFNLAFFKQLSIYLVSLEMTYVSAFFLLFLAKYLRLAHLHVCLKYEV